MENPRFHLLKWDTENFGYKVAQIDGSEISKDALKHIIASLLTEEVKVGYLFVDSSDSVSAVSAKLNNGVLVDEKITYAKQLTNADERIKMDKNIHSYLGHDISKRLLSLALQSGVYSRFKIDENFSQGEYEKLYIAWLEKSLNGTLAKEVLVYLFDGKEVGFLTLEEKSNNLYIGLLAVDKDYRGKNIGTSLMNLAFIKATEWGYNRIEVVTQKANTTACLFYEKNGFLLKKHEMVYHFWLENK